MDECPNCGEPLPKNAVACRECGSDAETGWSEDIDYYSVEIPDEDAKPLRSGPSWPLKVAVALLITVIFGGLWRVLSQREGGTQQLLILIGIIVAAEVLYSAGILKRSFFRKPGE